MFPRTSRPPLLYHVVSCTGLSLQLLGTQDFVDMEQTVFGGLYAMGDIQATLLRGREAG